MHRVLALMLICTMLTACGELKNVFQPQKPQSNASAEVPRLRSPYLGEPKDEYEEYLIDEHTQCRLKHKAVVKMIETSTK